MPSFYKQNRGFTAGEQLPKISTDIDSVRSYQFEVRFAGLPPTFEAEGDTLTLAAKQVSPVNVGVEDIVVDRVNDKLYYPGKFTPENVTVTFDNLYIQRSSLRYGTGLSPSMIR